jgi:YD repeat-containing protein
MTYDNRGNKISMNDPDMGRWTYTYNARDEAVVSSGIGGSVAVVGGFGAADESADGIILGGDKVALFVCEIG